MAKLAANSLSEARWALCGVFVILLVLVTLTLYHRSILAGVCALILARALWVSVGEWLHYRAHPASPEEPPRT